jgi:hypothetical protein
VHSQPIAETVVVVQIVTDRCLCDGFGEDLLDIEVDRPGLGVFQDLPLNVGQPGRCQIVEVEVNCAAPPAPFRIALPCRSSPAWSATS